MRKPLFPLLGPIANSRKRLAQLEEQKTGLNETKQPAEYARINNIIKFEMDFISSSSAFMKVREAKRRTAHSASAKGILQLLGLTVIVFIVIGIKRHYLG